MRDILISETSLKPEFVGFLLLYFSIEYESYVPQNSETGEMSDLKIWVGATFKMRYSNPLSRARRICEKPQLMGRAFDENSGIAIKMRGVELGISFCCFSLVC